jgi:hypothetical protein
LLFKVFRNAVNAYIGSVAHRQGLFRVGRASWFLGCFGVWPCLVGLSSFIA